MNQDANSPSGFDVHIDPGDAEVVDIQEVFAALSALNQALGGYGLTFTRRGQDAYVVEREPPRPDR